jgi:salicylate hydroxylase
MVCCQFYYEFIELIKIGIKSEARKIVLGGIDQPPREAGFAAYRAMVDAKKMKDHPDVSWLLDNPGQNLWYANV